MKILVTGGAGFIGSHIVDRYIAEGHEVIVADNLSSGRVTNIHPSAVFYEVDIRDLNAMEKLFAKERPDVVNHHAAQKSVPKSVQEPVLDASINIIGMLNLLMLSVQFNAKRFISVSSGGALAGDALLIPTKESSQVELKSPYAISKYIGEKYLHFFALTYGLEYVVLRYANVYGPRQTREGECGVIPIFMENLLDNKPSELFRYSDMPKGCTRDYVYVDDICDANVCALTFGTNDFFHIGSGQELYIEDIYELIQQQSGKSIPLIRRSERIGDVRRSALDCTKANEQLQWKAKTDLRTGIKQTYAYMMHSAYALDSKQRLL